MVQSALRCELLEPKFVWKLSRSLKIMCCVVVKTSDCVGFSLKCILTTNHF